MCDIGVSCGVFVVLPCLPPTGMHINEELCGEDIIENNTSSTRVCLVWKGQCICCVTGL